MKTGANSFRCRSCNSPSAVLKTIGEGDTTLRVRECAKGHRFMTREVFERPVRQRRAEHAGAHA